MRIIFQDPNLIINKTIKRKKKTTQTHKQQQKKILNCFTNKYLEFKI